MLSLRFGAGCLIESWISGIADRGWDIRAKFDRIVQTVSDTVPVGTCGTHVSDVTTANCQSRRRPQLNPAFNLVLGANAIRYIAHTVKGDSLKREL